MPSQSSLGCGCAEGTHRLGGVFVAGDRVLAHFLDGETMEGIVRSVMDGQADVHFEGVENDGSLWHPNYLWLVEP